MKKFSFLLTFLICAITFNVSANNNVVATYFVVNCRESITLRNAPSVYAAEITQIPLGQAVGFIENAGNGFYKINYDGLVGYALAQYLSKIKYSQDMPTGRVVNCRESITLRERPSVYAAEITQIPLGAQIIYIGNASNEFYKIQYRGYVGFALKAYIALD